MVMGRIFLFAALALVSGWALAAVSIAVVLPAGWVGALALVIWAVLARKKWEHARQTTGLEPGAPEQIIWLRTAGVGMLLGHLAFAVANPQIDLHLGRGNWLAIDSWTITLALLFAALLFRHDKRERDERHEKISALGVRMGYACCLLFLCLLVGFLAFAPAGVRAPLTHWILANLLIALLLASYLVLLVAQLIVYRPRPIAAGRERAPHA
jgi:hypothetical protein